MFPKRTMLRTSQRFAAQLRSPAVRTPFQRRFATTESSAFKGAEDNAFNRERKAVKDHAAATSGTYSPFEDVEEADVETDLWRKLSI